MSFPQSSKEFIDRFEDVYEEGYEEVVLLRDTKIGFSIQRKYPEGIRFKPAQNKAGEPDNVAVIWVVYKDKTEDSGTGLVPLRLRIAMMSKYRALNWDYDFEDAECPTKSSIKTSKESPQPLELTLNSEFFYDSHINGFCDARGNEVTGKHILDLLFVAHCNSVHPLKGLKHQSQRKLNEWILLIFDRSINGCIWVLKTVFGRILDESRDRSVFLDGYRRENFKKIELNSVTLLGYKAPIRVALFFCALVILTCVLALPVQAGSYADLVLENKILLTIHGVGLLIFLVDVLPHIIFSKLNWLISCRKQYLDRQLKRLF